MLALIEERRFFTLHAGRQTGKTTSLMWLEDHFNATEHTRALWVDLETARERPDEQRALDQLTGYLDRLGLDEGRLVMFDLREGPSWDERLTTREVDHQGKRVHLVGC